MKRTIRGFLVATTLLYPVAALAGAPDEAGAKSIEQAVKTFGPQSLGKPGLVRVSPDGDSYRLSLDLGKLIGDAVAPMTVKEASSLVFGLLEQPDGKWSFESTNPFKMLAEHLAANRSAALSIATETSEIRGVFDPAIYFPRAADVTFSNGVASLRDSRDAVKIAIKQGKLSSAVTDASSGAADVDGTFALQDVSLTHGTFPQPEVRISAQQIDGDYTLGKANLTAFAALMNFWKVTAANKELKDLNEAQRQELKALMNTFRPGVEAVGGKLTASNLSTSQGGKGFKLERLEHETRWEGLGGLATLSMDTRVRNFGVDAGIWPKPLEAALPREGALKVRASGFDMGAVWTDATELRTPEQIAALPRDHFVNMFLPDGKMTIDFGGSFARSSFYDLALSGQLQTGRDPRTPPVGTLTLAAKDLDTTVKYLQEHGKTVPAFNQASFGVLMMKGLGKPGADNSVVWEFKFEESGKITVNGQPLPMRR